MIARLDERLMEVEDILWQRAGELEKRDKMRGCREEGVMTNMEQEKEEGEVG